MAAERRQPRARPRRPGAIDAARPARRRRAARRRARRGAVCDRIAASEPDDRRLRLARPRARAARGAGRSTRCARSGPADRAAARPAGRRSRTSSTPPTSRPRTAPPIDAGRVPRDATPPSSRGCARPARSSSARRSRPSSPSCTRRRPRNPHDPGAHARRLVVRLGRGGRRRAWCRSPSARRPAAR